MALNYFLTLILIFSSLQLQAAEEIIQRKFYTLNYNEDHEVANWVSYELDHSKIQNCVQRVNNFRADPLISTGSASLEDYKGSGFDRGHLVPAGDMKFSKEAMSDTFYMSNMAPQPPKFNQGRWARLENLMRSWALKYKKIWIVTGPILRDNLPSIGQRNDVSVPDLYFKIVLRQEGAKFKGVAFLMPTDTNESDLSQFVTSINEVESLSGFDFFKFLSPSSEEEVENQADPRAWDFNGKFQYLPCQV